MVIWKASDFITWLVSENHCFDREEAVRLANRYSQDGYLCLLEADPDGEKESLEDNGDYWAFQSAALWPSRQFPELTLDYAVFLYRRQQSSGLDGAGRLKPYEVNRLMKMRDRLVGKREVILERITQQREYFIS